MNPTEFDHQNDSQLVGCPDWQSLFSNREKIIQSLQQVSRSMPAKQRKIAVGFVRWFRRHDDQESALKRPDVLEICWPLLHVKQHREWSEGDFLRAAQLGIGAAARVGINGQRLWQMLRPLLFSTLAVFLLVVVTSIFLIPEIDSFFRGFEIDPPQITVISITWSKVFNLYWHKVGVFGLAVVFVYWIFDWVTRDRRPLGQGSLERLLRKKRAAYAECAWHLSMLLRLGIGIEDAKEIVIGDESDLLVDLDSPANEDSNQRVPFGFIRWAVNQSNLEFQIACLEHISNYYRDRSQRVGEWWMKWLIALLMALLVFVVAILILAIATPLFAFFSIFGALT